MTMTARRLVTPLLWAILGWVCAMIANAVSFELSLRWSPLMHVGEIFMGLLFGTMRWLHGSWRVVYAPDRVDEKVRGALVVLQHGTKDSDKSKAVAVIVAALDQKESSRRHPE